jgi:hypothetical protein
MRSNQWLQPEQVDLLQPPQLELLLEESDDLEKKPDIRRFTRPQLQSGHLTPSAPALMLHSFSNLLWHS